jgi:hypothetical protein
MFFFSCLHYNAIELPSYIVSSTTPYTVEASGKSYNLYYVIVVAGIYSYGIALSVCSEIPRFIHGNLVNIDHIQQYVTFKGKCNFCNNHHNVEYCPPS